MQREKIKVLIVEDSPSVQKLLKKIIEDDPLLKVSMTATNGKEAIEYLERESPDVITMDIFMPQMDGFEATRKIMETKPLPIIIVSGHYTKADVEKSFEAINAGALSIMEKPPGIFHPNYPEVAKTLQKTIRSLAGLKLIKRHYRIGKDEKAAEEIEPEAKLKKIEAVAIGASLGGPLALKELFSTLPATFPLPIFVTQHISHGFGDGFIEWLDNNSPLKIVKAEKEMTPQCGHVYIAPDHIHMTLSKDKTIQLCDTPPIKTLKPAVAPLFSTASAAYGDKILGILLTGMGEDGSLELADMKKKGAITICQDEATCIAFGMPGCAVKLGGATHTLPLNKIAEFLKKIYTLKYNGIR